jgi:hypothetical protein
MIFASYKEKKDWKRDKKIRQKKIKATQMHIHLQ